MQPVENDRPKDPRVTVLLPCHRADSYLHLAIESILRQTMHDFELLIILDVRLRGSEASVKALAQGDPRVTLLPSLAVGGLAAGLNLGIHHARGKYIARMDGDDISLPDRLALQASYLDEHPETAVLGGRLELIDENGAKLSRAYPFYESDAQIRSVLPLRNPMPHPALMFRKDVLIEVGGYKYGHSAEDWELFLRITRNKAWHLHNLDQLLVQYRRHASQITRPELTGKVFYETSGFLFSEFLRTRSPRYLAGIAIKLPLLVRARLLWRKLRGAGDAPV